jgi:general secretion pathway protein I
MAARLLPARTEGGFTLLEVLVAFVIAALALGVLYEVAIGALNNGRVADRTVEAVSRARSHLAVVGHGLALRETTQEGDDGSGFSWRLRITPRGTATTGDSPGGGTRIVLFRVEVEERWEQDGHERRVLLDTDRVGTAPSAR